MTKKLPLLVLLVVGCASAPAKDASKAAECAAVRSFYDDAQSKLISSGACDTVDDITDCVPHVALRETLVATLGRLECPSDP